MSSTAASTSSSADTAAVPPPDDADRTGRARIRDAAIRCIADAGASATSVRTIAAAAGVSAGLVIHHFGSKDGLRAACDERVAALIRERKTAAMAEGTSLDPIGALRAHGDGPPVLRYLAHTLTDGSPHVAGLLDELVDDAETYMQAGIEAGVLRPTDDLRGRATVLTLWSLGALVLHDHAARLLGADLIDDDPVTLLPYIRPAMEIIGQGVLTDEMYRQLRAQLPAPDVQEG